MLVSTLLHAKGGDVATVRPDASVESIVGRLKSERVGALVVSDDGHRINGIVSERDVVRAIATSSESTSGLCPPSTRYNAAYTST